MFVPSRVLDGYLVLLVPVVLTMDRYVVIGDAMVSEGGRGDHHIARLKVRKDPSQITVAVTATAASVFTATAASVFTATATAASAFTAAATAASAVVLHKELREEGLPTPSVFIFIAIVFFVVIVITDGYLWSYCRRR